VEEVLAIIFIFGVPGLIGFTFTPMGRALTDRIRYGAQSRDAIDPALYEEVEQLRSEVAELHERVDFTERLLARQNEPVRLAGEQVKEAQ
jgi:hypothetical protein